MHCTWTNLSSKMDWSSSGSLLNGRDGVRGAKKEWRNKLTLSEVKCFLNSRTNFNSSLSYCTKQQVSLAAACCSLMLQFFFLCCVCVSLASLFLQCGMKSWGPFASFSVGHCVAFCNFRHSMTCTYLPLKVRIGRRGLLEKELFRKGPFSRGSRECRESRDSISC